MKSSKRRPPNQTDPVSTESPRPDASKKAEAKKDPGLFICIILALVTVILYARTRNYGFIIFDDPQYVSENPLIRQGLTLFGTVQAFTAIHSHNWHPLTTLSHMLDCQIFQLNAGSHHMVSVFLHAGATALLFLALRRMTGALWQSAVVAALFAWHPLHVESVAWIAERKDVLSGLFWMLTLWTYARYVAQPGSARYLMALGSFALGLLSKPMLVTLPFVLLLLDYWPMKRWTLAKPFQFPKSLIVEKLPFLALAVGSSIVTFAVQRESGAVATQEDLPISLRLPNTVVSYVRYLGKTVWPSDLAVYYPFTSWPLWAVIGSLVLVVGITVLAFRARDTAPYFGVGWLWFLGTMVPVIGLVQVGSQSMADRYTYLPSIGLFIALVWGVPLLLERFSLKPLGTAVGGVAMVACVVLTSVQLNYWRDSITLFEHTLQVTKGNLSAHHSLGKALADAGKLDEGAAQFRAALALKPSDAEMHTSLGVIYSRQGKVDEAIAEEREAIRINPKAFIAHANLAKLLAGRQQWADATKHFEEAIRGAPNDPELHLFLGNALNAQGKTAEAIPHYEESLKWNPNNATAHNNVAYLLMQRGSIREAIGHYQSAIALNPEYVMPINNLARLLATSNSAEFRNGAQAVSLAEKACALTGNRNPVTLDTLAMAYAEAGRFQEALRVANTAVELAAKNGDQALANLIQTHLQAFQTGKPWRE